MEGAFHGWLEMPFLPGELKGKREALWEEVIGFLRETYRGEGFVLEAVAEEVVVREEAVREEVVREEVAREEVAREEVVRGEVVRE